MDKQELTNFKNQPFLFNDRLIIDLKVLKNETQINLPSVNKAQLDEIIESLANDSTQIAQIRQYLEGVIEDCEYILSNPIFVTPKKLLMKDSSASSQQVKQTIYSEEIYSGKNYDQKWIEYHDNFSSDKYEFDDEMSQIITEFNNMRKQQSIQNYQKFQEYCENYIINNKDDEKKGKLEFFLCQGHYINRLLLIYYELLNNEEPFTDQQLAFLNLLLIAQPKVDDKELIEAMIELNQEKIEKIKERELNNSDRTLHDDKDKFQQSQ